ncbi:hypothetical protein [Paraburkholderia sp. MM5477-R1]|uniref:hypothetical protein n=1 Tax=Paraburkholderia sp. MM5477-R1 TaxID=2991062 RepID=UPI003D25761A
MNTSRKSMPRPLPESSKVAYPDIPRKIRHTVIDFRSLRLSSGLRVALADAFWNHYGVREADGILSAWKSVQTFGRFVDECGLALAVPDMNSDLLARYVEWLNKQCRLDGRPLSLRSRARPYVVLCRMLRWLMRCRPALLCSIEFPHNPFPWRDRGCRPFHRISAQQLRDILRACEDEITQFREARVNAAAQDASCNGSLDTLADLLAYINQRLGGIIPSDPELRRSGQYRFVAALSRFDGRHMVEPLLYPRYDSLLAYYIAMLIHTAGNPVSIAELGCDCLHPIPLLDGRQALVWRKRRTTVVQRRSFSKDATFEPPSLVRDIVQWSSPLRPLAPVALRNRLFLFKDRGDGAMSALKVSSIKHVVTRFCARHGLPRFSVAGVRPSVLTAFYRCSGDIQAVRVVANHAHISTTIRYVESPDVMAMHQRRIAALQLAFLGHIVRSGSPTNAVETGRTKDNEMHSVPSGETVSLFGFGCRDPFAGVAPDTHRGELCTNFMGCFTCPNAIISPDPVSVARLLQARNHLREAAATLHPARWSSVYAPQLHVLEEDILTRFAARQLAAGERCLARLPPLPELR